MTKFQWVIINLAIAGIFAVSAGNIWVSFPNIIIALIVAMPIKYNHQNK